MKARSRFIPFTACFITLAVALSIFIGQGLGQELHTGEGPASPDEDFPLYLPMATKPLNNIFGYVTDSGLPAAGVLLDLWHDDGATPAVLMTIATDTNGHYRFLDAPPLGPGESYWVRYENEVNPARLYEWYTRELTSFPDGSSVNIGNFDIANVVYTAPSPRIKIVLPFNFQWTPRPATPTDSYQFEIFDYLDLNPTFSTAPLGYTGSYNLSSLPAGFQYCNLYVWAIALHSPDGGSGYSYWAYTLTLHQSALAGIHGCVTENGVPVSGVEVDLSRWTGSDVEYRGTATTSNGYYSFTGQPGLEGGQGYWVDYWNPSNPNRLSQAWTRSLTSYDVGSTAFLGDFDIKNIPLTLPVNNVITGLPTTFQWDDRPNSLWDDYEFDLYDPDDGNPSFWTDPTLGYEDHYTLAALPAGFSPGVWYAWEVWVYDMWDGGGISYETRNVSFSSLGMSVSPGEAPEHARIDTQRLRNRQRSPLRQQYPRGMLNAGITRYPGQR